MDYLPFPAVLTAEYNGIHEFGEGRVLADDNAIDFTSDFVPLIPLGAAAGIDWVLGGQTIAHYGGSVYLSSKTAMRLVEVEPDVIAKTRVILASNTCLPATVRAQGAPAENAVPAEIVFLSMDYIKLRIRTYLPEADTILLCAEVDFLTLANLRLSVRRRVAMQGSETLLLCETQKMDEANYIALTAYVARLDNLEQKPEED